jgi:chromosome partitioning protein
VWYSCAVLTLAVANHKGGVGKTTSAVNLSAALARAGARVLVVDLDAQASATQWLLGDYGERGRVVRNILLDRAPLAGVIVEAGGLSLAPSDLSLAKIDIELALKPNADGRLAAALEPVAARYDFCLIDCPPSLGIATYNAFTASDVVVVPIDCRAQAFEAVPQLLDAVVECGEAYGRSVLCCALPTFYERTTVARRILELTRERFESATFSPVHKSTKLAEAYIARQTIFDYAPTTTGAIDYARLAREVREDLAAPAEARRAPGRAQE